MKTRPCPYCGKKLLVARDENFVCTQRSPWRYFRFDGRQFRRVKKFWMEKA